MQPRPLLIVGNKRCGTSLLVDLLNCHPGVFVTPESDVVWILFQLASARPLAPYPFDGPMGMQRTVEACADVIRGHQETPPEQLGDREAIRELFMRIQLAMMSHHGQARTELAWLGDKKPVQHGDPLLRPFIHEHFADGRLVHIVRHPGASVASAQQFASERRVGVPVHWRGSLEEVLESWTLHERRVLELKADGRLPCLSIRMEDLVAAPADVMAKVFGFLDLDLTPDCAAQVAGLVRPGRVHHQEHGDLALSYGVETRKVMELYGYR